MHNKDAPENEGAAPALEIACRIGAAIGCPYLFRSCENARACMAPTPTDDDSPQQYTDA